MEDNVDLEKAKEKKKGKKRTESGIIYLSRVPTLMNVNIVRRQFQNYGEVGRIFLQPDVKAKARGKRGRVFSEGWVEFMNKKVAKRVASALNNTLIGGKKKSKWREELWNIKYLSKFKWAHLNERLAYEKAVHAQRMRAEISQAKREANFHIQNAEKKDRQARQEQRKQKKAKKLDKQNDETIGDEDNADDRIYSVKLKETEEEIVSKRKQSQSDNRPSKVFKNNIEPAKTEDAALKKKVFLSKIFSSGRDDSDVDD